MCLAQGPQRSDAGEAWTRSPSVSSQALYHWATALPLIVTAKSGEAKNFCNLTHLSHAVFSKSLKQAQLESFQI